LSQKSISKLPEISQNLKLFCYLCVRENSLDLYGFLDEKELEFFEILNDIRGIGPKVALEISSLGPLEKIKEKILNQDENIFTGISGIGKKRTMAIILELSGKIKEIPSKSRQKEIIKDDAEDALVGLGFSRSKARDALGQISLEIKETDKRVKEALKILGR
jgi:Holliday junction DNA helicase RuvA